MLQSTTNVYPTTNSHQQPPFALDLNDCPVYNTIYSFHIDSFVDKAYYVFNEDTGAC